MELKNKPRNHFYDNELDINRMNEVLNIAIKQLTLTEFLKMTKEVIYDQTAYYDKDSKGVLYNGKYTDDNIWQATMLGNGARALLSVFEQSIIQKREYESDYFDKWNLTTLQADRDFMAERIRQLELRIKRMNEDGIYE